MTMVLDILMVDEEYNISLCNLDGLGAHGLVLLGSVGGINPFRLVENQ